MGSFMVELGDHLRSDILYFRAIICRGVQIYQALLCLTLFTSLTGHRRKSEGHWFTGEKASA